MEYLERPKVILLEGEEAVESLKRYIKELSENKPEELTEQQAKAMIKLAECLIQTIEGKSSSSVKQETPHEPSRPALPSQPNPSLNPPPQSLGQPTK